MSAPAPPTITSFTASPTKITSGQSSTLSWSISGAASVSISGIGTVTGTSVAVNPSTTTSYTLTATNAAGSNTATITVAVETQLPVITDFWSNPVQIASGQTATLSWFVSQADSLTLDNRIGTVTGTSWSVSPTTTATYTLTATNLIGSVTATVTVSVGAPGALVWKKTMVYGFGQELAEDQPGMGTTFIQSDFVGSPSITTNASGAMIGRSKALPFGERYGQWGQKTVRRYTNHEDDSDSNAIYMQAREYLPAYGKFAQVDPAYDQTKDDPESWNLYNYVTNNPVTHTDPDGRMAPAMLSPAQKAMLEDTGSAMGSDGSLWTVQAEGGGDLSGEVTNSTQPSASDGTSVSPGGVDANASANGGSGTGAGKQGEAPKVGYFTPEEAAKAAYRDLEKRAGKKIERKEYGGLIYQYSDGSYGFTEAVEGTATSSMPEKTIDQVPNNVTYLVGTYHSHPLEGTVTFLKVGAQLKAVRATNVDHPSTTTSTQAAAGRMGDIQIAASHVAPQGISYGVTQSMARGERTILWTPNDQQISFVASPRQIEQGKVVPYTGNGEMEEQ